MNYTGCKTHQKSLLHKIRTVMIFIFKNRDNNDGQTWPVFDYWNDMIMAEPFKTHQFLYLTMMMSKPGLCSIIEVVKGSSNAPIPDYIESNTNISISISSIIWRVILI